MPETDWEKRFVATEYENKWLDSETNKVFGYISRDKAYSGGWFDFNCDNKTWVSGYAISFFKHYFGNWQKYHTHGNLLLTPEVIITSAINKLHEEVKNSSVLVIGGGPSTKDFHLEKVCDYDHVFSCNYFYKNFKNVKASLLLLGHQVDLKDPELVSYNNRFKPYIGFEHSDKRTIDPINIFKQENSANTFLFLTRYFSRLGYVSRAIILASLLGASKVDYVGFDGFKTSKMNVHAFEGGKNPPPFYNKQILEQQAFVFWHYLNSLELETSYNNLAEDSNYNAYSGIKQYAEKK